MVPLVGTDSIPETFSMPLILYALTVYCTVYQLKKDGLPLDLEAAKSAGIVGNLRLTRKRETGMPAVEAVLLDDAGAQIMCISSAEVRRIQGDGMLIHGMEHLPAWVIAPQVWWCVLHQTDEKNPPVPKD